VKYKTRDGSAHEGSDYEATEGRMVFEPDEMKKKLAIKIHDDNAYEENEEFYVDLSEPLVEGGGDQSVVGLALISSVTVVIIDNDEPGKVRFQKEEVEAEEGIEETSVQVVVERNGGASGTIGCRYHTEDMGAVAGLDYKEAGGVLELGPAIQTFSIPVAILARGRYDNSAGFNVVLTEPVGCKFDRETDGGEDSCICHITIKGNNGDQRSGLLCKMEQSILSRQATLGHSNWKRQFWAAIFDVMGEDEEAEEGDEPASPTKLDYFIHIISVPWKLMFALVPPVDYCNGWACFFGALCMIAVVTAIVGDLANLVGCCLNINPEITAITFVALGTSLPDTFASKAAAVMDPFADASIGNITGSNSVNVFLGLGLSWSLAAFYWECAPAPQDWMDKVFKPDGVYYDLRGDVADKMRGGNAVFVVPAGSLWFNLMVFSCNAIFAVQHLLARRRKWGGELGGPKHGFMGQYFSASFLVAQWFIYITASAIFATVKEMNAEK